MYKNIKNKMFCCVSLLCLTFQKESDLNFLWGKSYWENTIIQL